MATGTSKEKTRPGLPAVIVPRRKQSGELKNWQKNQDLVQVVIHKNNGIMQTEHTYGKDPYPSKE